MASRFLSKTNLQGIEPLRSPAGVLALESYKRLQTLLTNAIGPAGSDLLAEPIMSWGSTTAESSVSWYTEARGEPATLLSVSAERRRLLEARLTDTLSRLRPLLNDANAGPLLRQGLCALSPASLWAVGDQIVLAEWGLAAADRAHADPMALFQHSPLAAYLSLEGAPAVAAPSAPRTAAVPTAPPATVPSAAPRPLPAYAAPVAPRRGVMSWWLVPAAIIVAALFLALGYWRGSVLANERASARKNTVTVLDEPSVKDATDKQLELNASLERQLADRRKLLAGNVCRPDPETMPRLGPDRAAAPPPASVPPPTGGQPFQGNLADLLKQALVMVVVPTGGDDVSLGSGFYVTPELIVTNRHVVEKGTGRVGVINEKLGKLIPAQVVATSSGSDVGTLDLALLRVAANPAVQPLSLTTTAAELDPVIAAGYPALVIRGDAATRKLLVDGDLTSAPIPVLTDGRINAIQSSSSGLKIMPHSASISGGNSGGPLVDVCGRVVGVNTFITTDQEQTAHVNYAEKADAVIAFLKEHGATITELSGPCQPAAPPAPAPAPAPGSTPAAPPAPPAAAR